MGILPFHELALRNKIPIRKRFTTERKYRHYFKHDDPIFFETRAFCSWMCTMNGGQRDAAKFYLLNPLREGKIEILQAEDCIYMVNWFRAFQMAYAKSKESFLLERSGEQIHAAPDNSCLVMIDDLSTPWPLPFSGKCGHPDCAIIETSPGNYQHFYACDRKLTSSERFAIQKNLAQKFDGDPGATGGNQLHRIPGSVNYKPGKNLYIAKFILNHINGYRLKASEYCDPERVKPPNTRISDHIKGSGMDTSPSGIDWHIALKRLADGAPKDDVYQYLFNSAKARGKRNPQAYAHNPPKLR